MGAVASFVEDAVSSVGDAVGAVAQGVGHIADQIVTHVVEPVAQTVAKTIEAAAQDPIGTAAKIAVAVVAPELLPLVSAADTMAHGGSLEDGLKSAAVSYVAQGVGQAAGRFGDQVGAAAQYGTDVGSQQTAMLAAQDAGMKTVGDLVGNVIGGTAAGVARGQDPLTALTSSGIGAATTAITNQIDGFSDLAPAVQKSVNIAVSSALQGGDPSNALINAALNAGIAEARGASAPVQTEAAPAAKEPEVVQDSGISNRIYDEYTGIPAAEDGLPSIAPKEDTQPVAAQEEGIASLKDNGDGTFSEKMSDGSEIIKDSAGNIVAVKSATQVEFEAQAKQAEPEKTQDQMTAQDWADLYGTPTTNPITGETIVGGNVANYNVQDLGFGDQVDFGSSQDPYAGWKLNDDGTHTRINDDGSTMTVNEDGDIIDVTEASDTPYSPASETSKPASGLDSLYLNLVPGAGKALGGAAGAAALGSLLAGQDSSQLTDEQKMKLYGMDWNQQGVNSLVNGVAYGQRFFDPTFKELPTTAAQGGLMSLAVGGHAGANYNLGSYSDGGRLLRGPGDGMSDNIPATIGHKQPARLADGEFVVPADVVSHLGNGSTDAGSKVLYKMMDKVRRARTGNSKQGKQINPNKFVPG